MAAARADPGVKIASIIGDLTFELIKAKEKEWQAASIRARRKHTGCFGGN